MIRKLRLNPRHVPLAFGTLLAATLFVACQPAPNTGELPAGDRAALSTCASDEGPSDAKCTTVEVFDTMGHNLMGDVGWERVADRVDSFVRTVTETAHSPA